MIGAIARRSVFWMLDSSKGGQIKAELEEIRRRNQNTEVNTPQLQYLLAHAVSTSDYYKNCDPSDLNSFPVLSKNQLREHWDEICSDAFKGQNLYTTSTSGSTGIPLKMVWNPQKRSHQLADVVYMNELLGQKVDVYVFHVIQSADGVFQFCGTVGAVYFTFEFLFHGHSPCSMFFNMVLK